MSDAKRMKKSSAVLDRAQLIKQGAEAKIYRGTFLGKPTIIKERFSKSYRHPTLDISLTTSRTKSEVRLMMRSRMNGIQTPAVYFVDLESNRIYMEDVQDSITVRDYVNQLLKSTENDQCRPLVALAEKIGCVLGSMHKANLIHGDLTTSNLLLRNPPETLDLVMIDFGLGYVDSLSEDKGVDLYVLERAFLSTHPNTEHLFTVILDSYKTVYGQGSVEVIKKLDEVRLRGRKRTMVG